MKHLFAGLILFFASVTASAEFIFEPYLGYEIGSYDYTFKTGGNSKGSANGIFLGGRALYKLRFRLLDSI